MSLCAQPLPPRRVLRAWGIDEWTHHFLLSDLDIGRAPDGGLQPCYHSLLEERCAAYRAAHATGNQVCRRLAKLHRSPFLITFLEVPMANALVGFCQGEHWAREGLTVARVARYRLTADHFEVAAELLEDHPQLGLRDLVPDCRRTAVALRAAVSE